MRQEKNLWLQGGPPPLRGTWQGVAHNKIVKICVGFHETVHSCEKVNLKSARKLEDVTKGGVGFPSPFLLLHSSLMVFLITSFMSPGKQEFGRHCNRLWNKREQTAA